MTSPPRDVTGEPLTCVHCGTRMRPTSLTAEGASYSCDCGALSATYLSQGMLDLGIVKEAYAEDSDWTDAKVGDTPDLGPLREQPPDPDVQFGELKGPCDEHPIKDWGT